VSRDHSFPSPPPSREKTVRIAPLPKPPLTPPFSKAGIASLASLPPTEGGDLGGAGGVVEDVEDGLVGHEDCRQEDHGADRQDDERLLLVPDTRYEEVDTSAYASSIILVYRCISLKYVEDGLVGHEDRRQAGR
jgi:hypothetical protein